MRMILITAALAVPAFFAGCASTGGEGLTYQQEYRQLQESCTERGGVLSPSAAAGVSGRPALDYICEIRGGPSERLSRPADG